MVSPSSKNLLELFNYECLYCGGELNDTSLTKEHLLPRSFGGKSNIHNLAAACARCNNVRGNIDLEQFIMSQANAETIKLKLEYMKIRLLHRYNQEQFNTFKNIERKIKAPKPSKAPTTRTHNSFWARLGYNAVDPI